MREPQQKLLSKREPPAEAGKATDSLKLKLFQVPHQKTRPLTFHRFPSCRILQAGSSRDKHSPFHTPRQSQNHCWGTLPLGGCWLLEREGRSLPTNDPAHSQASLTEEAVLMDFTASSKTFLGSRRLVVPLSTMLLS